MWRSTTIGAGLIGGFIVGVDSHPDGPTVDVDCGDMVWRHVPAGRMRRAPPVGHVPDALVERHEQTRPVDAHVGDVEQHVRGVVVVDPVGPVAAGRIDYAYPSASRRRPRSGACVSARPVR